MYSLSQKKLEISRCRSKEKFAPFFLIAIPSLFFFLNNAVFAQPSPPPWMDPIAESISSIEEDVTGIQDSISALGTDLSDLAASCEEVGDKVDLLRAEMDARFDALELSLSNGLAQLESNLGEAIAQNDALPSKWISPDWAVREGEIDTSITVFNPSDTTEIIVDFNFYDRDGVLDALYSTARRLPPRATYTLLLDDRGEIAGRFGWVQLDATGPVMPQGFILDTYATVTTPVSLRRRPMIWYKDLD
jgi:hypothetical protein